MRRLVLHCAELSQRVHETQQTATPSEPPEVHMHRVHRLSSSTQEAKENVDYLNIAAR